MLLYPNWYFKNFCGRITFLSGFRNHVSFRLSQLRSRFIFGGAQSSISISSTFWYLKHIANSKGKLIFKSSARRLLCAALLERWPEVCRVKITFTVLPTNRIVSTTRHSMKRVVNWIQFRSTTTQNPCLFDKYPIFNKQTNLNTHMKRPQQVTCIHK